MKNWKIIIEQDGQTQTLTIIANSYADAYVKMGTEHPKAVIKSITEIKESQNN